MCMCDVVVLLCGMGCCVVWCNVCRLGCRVVVCCVLMCNVCIVDNLCYCVVVSVVLWCNVCNGC